MINPYDVIVIGVGAMGASACWQLAQRGVRVLGLEQFSIPNTSSSHHGQSRIIRQAIFEHPEYVPLVQRAYANWRQLEIASGQSLLHIVGGLYLGRPNAELIPQSLQVLNKHKFQYESLTCDQVMQRYPMFRIPPDFVGLIESATGFIDPELAIATMATEALRHGAELHGHEPVTGWQINSCGVSVKTALQTYRADKIIFCGGAWSQQLLGEVGVKLTVTRQVLAWVWPRKPNLFQHNKLPVWLIETDAGGVHYGFPMRPGRPGFKLAWHSPGIVTEPDRIIRDPLPQDQETFRPILESFIPDANGPLLSLATCLYTHTPDGHFIVDHHPHHFGRAVVACGFCGSGFKFASVIGEALADLATQEQTNLPITFLNLARFER